MFPPISLLSNKHAVTKNNSSHDNVSLAQVELDNFWMKMGRNESAIDLIANNNVLRT